MTSARWLLLIHSLPPKPLYLRAKIRQRLARVGAVLLKNSVYVLPAGDETGEDFQWIAQEARAGGGEAFVCTAHLVEGVTDEELVARFRAERDRDYAAVRDELRAFSPQGRGRPPAPGPEHAAALARARRHLDEIQAIDFFASPGRKEAEAMIRKAERLGSTSGGAATDSAAGRASRHPDLSGRVWVTRSGVKVDRIASAWLVRRFIDPAARFRFVDPASDVPRPDELRFDMAGGDFTHEGERCTFETLRTRARVKDPALEPIAQIVHDIDLKDGKYARPEAPGVKQLLEGLLAAHPKDEDRLERGFALFDDLLASFRNGPVAAARKKKTATKA